MTKRKFNELEKKSVKLILDIPEDTNEWLEFFRVDTGMNKADIVRMAIWEFKINAVKKDVETIVK